MRQARRALYTLAREVLTAVWCEWGYAYVRMRTCVRTYGIQGAKEEEFAMKVHMEAPGTSATCNLALISS